MEEYVKQSIEARKMAFTNAYEINSDIKMKIDDLFSRINALGESCKNITEFENKFSTSSLNQEYIDLFTKIGTTCKPIVHENNNADVKSDKEYIKDEVESDIKYAVDDLTMPARRKAREELDSKLRSTPLGKIEQISNTTSLLRKIFKKND